jgi:uncharacterized protein (UPF0335 family)
MEKVERLEQEYNKLRKALEFIMSVVEGIDTEDLKKRVFEKRKKELSTPPDCNAADNGYMILFL